MAFKNTPSQYGSVTKTLHWFLFFLLAIMLSASFFIGEAPENYKGVLYNYHKLTGLSIGVLMLIRIGWILCNPKPAPLPNTPAWQTFLARSVHYLLYLFVLIMPLTGWIMSSASNRPPHIFGRSFSLLGIPVDKSLAKLLSTWHTILAWVIISLIFVHITAALKHHYLDKDNTLKRMLP